MNERTSYEQLIAEKAGQCTVPDMADAIWATIDAGLNEAPGDANNSSQPGNTTVKFTQWRKLWLFAGSGIVLTAIVLIWLNYKSEKSKPENYPQQPKNQPSPVQPKMDSLQIDSVTSKKATHRYSLPAPTAVPLKADSASVKKDTLANLPPVSVPKIDSVQQHQRLIPDSSASVPPPHKQRGVKGITLDDYKIVPVNKDTGNNKN
ncbi:hypothetical protein A3860_29900 [Niastella vici]|uniref:Uncharacterized protein n=1 Tax=Niastella vici TaxID=1703345 RepID=A0A1V9FU94_9BACT|nr:hypothetical protein [Niastella vici]OQP61912.1 hypothetical protein A3860_29900 [Niastella vici]